MLTASATRRRILMSRISERDDQITGPGKALQYPVTLASGTDTQRIFPT